MNNSSIERAEAENVSVPIPNDHYLRMMGCPEQACDAVRERLLDTPPEERVSLDQIQTVIQQVTEEK